MANWIQPEDFSFNCFLLMERFQIRLICNKQDEKLKSNLGIALHYNPSVKWYFTHKCPKCVDFVNEITANAPECLSADDIRVAELISMAAVKDFITYTKPEVMDQCCEFIYAWKKERLLEMVDFSGKDVLDVGSGSGRLAFAAAESAHWVYASEPVDTLREYLRDKITREGIRNIRVVDGMAHCLPYPDNTFDIVVSGHVIGDDYDAELAELIRVVKSGGWILDCPGEESQQTNPGSELLKRGWEELSYRSPLNTVTYRYRKQIIK